MTLTFSAFSLRTLASLGLLLASFSTQASMTFTDDLSALDGGIWHKADGWTNGSMFDVGWRADHATVSGGELVLSLDDMPCSVDPVACSGKDYASGEYRTNDFFSFGRYEARFQAASGDGLITSFFTYTGPSDVNPHDEIDIEILGQDTTKVQFNYWVNGVGGHETVIDLGFDAAAGFNDYAFEWRADRIDWYVNGQMVHSESTITAPSTPGRIMMNLWAVTDAASGWAGKFQGGPAQARYDSVSFTSLGDLTEVSLPLVLWLFLSGLVMPRLRRKERFFC